MKSIIVGLLLVLTFSISKPIICGESNGQAKKLLSAAAIFSKAKSSSESLKLAMENHAYYHPEDQKGIRIRMEKYRAHMEKKYIPAATQFSEALGAFSKNGKAVEAIGLLRRNGYGDLIN